LDLEGSKPATSPLVVVQCSEANEAVELGSLDVLMGSSGVGLAILELWVRRSLALQHRDPQLDLHLHPRLDPNLIPILILVAHQTTPPIAGLWRSWVNAIWP
jgi:hypothetical protein